MTEQMDGFGKALYAFTIHVSFPKEIEVSIGTTLLVSATLSSDAQEEAIVITQVIPVEHIVLNEETQLQEVDFEGILYLGETQIDYETLTTSANLYYVQA